MATPLTGNMHMKQQTIKANDHYKCDKHEKFEKKHNTVDQGLPPHVKWVLHSCSNTEGWVSFESSWVGLVGMHREVWPSLQASTWDQRQ